MLKKPKPSGAELSSEDIKQWLAPLEHCVIVEPNDKSRWSDASGNWAVVRLTEEQSREFLRKFEASTEITHVAEGKGDEPTELRELEDEIDEVIDRIWEKELGDRETRKGTVGSLRTLLKNVKLGATSV